MYVCMCIYIFMYVYRQPPSKTKQLTDMTYLVKRVGNHICAVHGTEKAIFRSVRL